MPRNFLAFGEYDRFADAHQADRDAGAFPRGGKPEIDAKIGCRGVAPEFGLGEIAGAKDSRVGEQRSDGAFEVGGREFAGDQKFCVDAAGPGSVHRTEQNGQALRFAEVAEDGDEKSARLESEVFAEAELIGCIGKARVDE